MVRIDLPIRLDVTPETRGVNAMMRRVVPQAFRGIDALQRGDGLTRFSIKDEERRWRGIAGKDPRGDEQPVICFVESERRGYRQRQSGAS